MHVQCMDNVDDVIPTRINIIQIFTLTRLEKKGNCTIIMSWHCNIYMYEMMKGSLLEINITVVYSRVVIIRLP